MTTFVVMKSTYAHIVPLLAHLADNLDGLLSERVVAEACERNPWFSADDVAYAVQAIRAQYLDADNLVEWLDAHAPLPVAQPRKVGVIAAGNIPLAGFFDVMCVLAAGHRCMVKPSGKDEVLMMALCRFLRSCGAPLEILHDLQSPDALIASGSDTTIAAIADTWGNTPLLLRGHRTSVAVLDGRESGAMLLSLGEDMFRYNSQGCRNVTLLWVPEDYDVEHLVRTLQPLRPLVSPKFVNNYRQAKATAMLTGESLVDGGYFVLGHSDAFPMRLAQVNIATYRSAEQVQEWLVLHDSHIQCVVGRNSVVAAHPRGVTFGQAQRPTLNDWPDGVDVLQFLATL